MNRKLWLGQVPLVVRPWGGGGQISDPRRGLGNIEFRRRLGYVGEASCSSGGSTLYFDQTAGCGPVWIDSSNPPTAPPCVGGQPAGWVCPGAPAAPPAAPSAAPPSAPSTQQGTSPAFTRYQPDQGGAVPPPSWTEYAPPGGGGEGGGGGVIPTDTDLFAPAPSPDTDAAAAAPPIVSPAPTALPATAPAPSGPFPVQNLMEPAVPTGAYPGAPFTAVAPRPAPRPTRQAPRAPQPAPRAPQPIPCPTGPIPVEQWTKGCVFGALARRP